MENEMEIFRAWLKKYVNEDKKITGVAISEKLKEKGFKSSKATISAYVSGRIINEERKFTKIPIEVREAIAEIIGIPYDKILKEGRKILYSKSKIYTETNIDSIELKDDNKIFKINDVLEAEHLSIIRQFKNKDMACSINKKLVELEALDSTAFAEIIVEIKKKINEAKAQKKRPAANGED